MMEQNEKIFTFFNFEQLNRLYELILIWTKISILQLLRTLATQAMSNAAYFSTGSLPNDQFFHYGLALDLYTHFTSPIRRYADVIVSIIFEK